MSAPIIPLSAARAAARSLSDQDCFSIAAALQSLPGGWQAQRDEDEAGLVVMTLFTGDEDAAPAFEVRRDACGLRLRDPAHTLGCYGNAWELIRACRRALGRQPD